MSVDQVEAEERGPLAVETDERAARADWVSTVLGTAFLTIVTGAWLAASPLVIDYGRPALAVVCGLVIAVIGLARLLGAPGSIFLALVGIAAGVGTVLTAFLGDETSGATANIALMGLGAVMLSLLALAAAAERGRRSRA